MFKQIKLWIVFPLFFSFCIVLHNSALTANQQDVPEPKYEVRLEESREIRVKNSIKHLLFHTDSSTLQRLAGATILLPRD